MTNTLLARTNNFASTLRGLNGRTKRALGIVAAGAAALAGSAMAFTAPAAGQLGFEIYDVVVNDMIDGPIGIGASIIAFGYGAMSLMRGGYLGFIMSVVAGIALITADSVVQSLGFVV